ncbi:MAG: ABC transporter ATP-binding protein [Okeania sp. SIO2G4]|uniref:ABC transporter ATP-binding protein n=1 Tax=unclassified Okeania TaxID=2634635 RepID=UPI0013B86A03|nr:MULTISPECIES: ABC transporter ATP-binding protein [unclassified Okeania]NEP05180.1 ABC transporter ATP-binding protein [Okeania sp. SIO4D6]NEP71874.1 ABC transporter ATP-binding protein [Okeania sp. SIO2G5]NEP92894.1 ABC transporter ATP-binding protein [Okeania sp. SIO2F5]NEQ90970.1 ABC transporter ATP-binding protein [Okeania sp. SIO2G4]
MAETVISLQNVSKCFKRYGHPVDRLKEILFPGKSRADEFWAVQNINIEIERGHTLGIVGRNGSGKSTLLQIIVGTLTPTTGTVKVQGRVSALLELGSGFNPEFTGRQNVFFNGQLLGLKPSEIEEKFDKIAGFADIGDFIDEPVKTYSSGMFIRLGFAVATSVDPDILVVDEALSVGDEAFQRKCFARIQDIQERGGTILFVSHAASTVVQLCDSAILMDHGEMLLYHAPKYVVSKYQKLIYAFPDKIPSIREEIRQIPNLTVKDFLDDEETDEQSSQSEQSSENKISESTEYEEIYDPEMIPSNTIHYPNKGSEIIDPHIITLDGKRVNHLINRREYYYTYTVKFINSTSKVRFGMLIKTLSGFDLGGASLHGYTKSVEYIEAQQKVIVKFKFKCLLNPGVYFLNAGVVGMAGDHLTYLSRCIDIAMFRVQHCSDSCGTGVVDFLIEPSLKIRNMTFI